MDYITFSHRLTLMNTDLGFYADFSESVVVELIPHKR